LIFGGFGNDAITTGSGNDTIWGNEGNDTMTGGAGADQYVFAVGSGADLILGFSATEGDHLDLQGQTYTIGSAPNGDAVLTLSGGGTITLAGIGAGAFQAGFVL
jgi:Ca2+-binding RTX toxin-like protein